MLSIKHLHPDVAATIRRQCFGTPVALELKQLPTQAPNKPSPQPELVKVGAQLAKAS